VERTDGARAWIPAWAEAFRGRGQEAPRGGEHARRAVAERPAAGPRRGARRGVGM